MMGERPVMQEALFYEFSLERHVPADHLLRSIDRFVDLSGLRAHLRPFYSEIGRPSIDPELMIRMLIVGYCFGIRSERRLCEEVHLNLAYRWFCRLGLDGDVPDHSTFSKNRHGRFRDSDLLRELFETTVRRCIAEGLVGGEGFAVDASLIKADANRQRSAEGSEPVDWEAMAETRRSVREYLDTLDDAAFGAASAVTPKFISPSDPAAQWTGAHEGARLLRLRHQLPDRPGPRRHRRRRGEPRHPPGRGRRGPHDDRAHPGALRPLARAAGRRQRLWLGRDPRLAGARARDRAAHPGLRQVRAQRRHLQRADFTYDHERDLYTCPGGKELRQRQKVYRMPRPLVDENGLMRYRASKLDCDACALKPRCCPNTPARKILRSIHEGARDMARDIATTDAYVTSRRERKKVEMLFAHLKRILRLDRLRLRGPNGARDEFLLAATAQNLRKLAKLIPMPAPSLA